MRMGQLEFRAVAAAQILLDFILALLVILSLFFFILQKASDTQIDLGNNSKNIM